jgi:hypothetical protein
MRLVLLCSSLEEGRDGVGDYCRLLAAEFARAGVPAGIIALNDRFVSEPQQFDDNDSGIQILRLPAIAPWAARLLAARTFLERFQPVCISLQFVCYGFDSRGLIFGLTQKLHALIAGRPLHITFHELWIGESTGYGRKDRALGFIQKKLILAMAHRLRPFAVHTSVPVYRQLLAAGGIASAELPLFGNIPVSKNADPGWLYTQLNRHHLPVQNNRDAFLFAGIFGSIHPDWNPAPFLDRFAEVARDLRRRPVLLAAGRIGATGARLLDGLSSHYGTDLPCISLGELPAERISDFLQNLDFGLATSPWPLIGKSGTAAAMIDHGIPVMVTRDDWKLRSGITPEPTPHPFLFQKVESLLAALPVGLRTCRAGPRHSEIAQKMIRELRLQETPGKSAGAETDYAPFAKA